MALTIGSITVSESGEATGTGLAFALFEALLEGSTEEDRASVAAQMAPKCEAMADAIINHFLNNAEITVTVSAGDLQTLPTSLTAGEPTDAPATPQQLTGALA
jgi:hypothetical protein